MEQPVEASRERAWREIAAIDAALEAGEIDEDGWYRAMAALVVPAYVFAGNPRAQSGHSGDKARWELARRLVVDAIERDGTFLDVGCANGLLMESVVAWSAAKGVALEPYGLDIAPELVELARMRLPEWAERIFLGNALGWEPPRRFTFVRTGLDYVPARRRRELLARLLDRVVEPGGRLIVGVVNEEWEVRATEQLVTSFGFDVTGRTERAHRDPRIVYRAFWLDAA